MQGALSPSVAPRLIKLGAKLHMQTGAGNASSFPTEAFKDVEFLDERYALLDSLHFRRYSELWIWSCNLLKEQRNIGIVSTLHGGWRSQRVWLEARKMETQNTALFGYWGHIPDGRYCKRERGLRLARRHVCKPAPCIQAAKLCAMG